MKRSVFLSLILLLGSPLLAAEATVPSGEGIPADLDTEVKSRGILGADDRRSTRYIPDYLEKYKRRVGELITYGHDQPDTVSRATCTGALIQKNYIITAAHCAFDSDGRLLENPFFYPGIEGGRVTYGKYRIARVFLPARYKHRADLDTGRDIAIMELEQSDQGKHAGELAGWFGFWGRKEFPSGKVTTLGYPGDKERSHQYYQENCNAVNSNPYDLDDLRIDCDVYRGQSGSPVLVYSPDYDEFHVQGVIQSESPNMNFGSRVSPERADIFRYIIKGQFDSEAYKAEGFAESWTRLEFEKKNIVHVYARNDCSNDDLLLAYRYKGLDGEWRTQGFIKIEPENEVEIFTSGNGVYYFSARTPDGEILTRSDIRHYMASYEREVGMQKYNTLEYGTFTYGFGCY